VTDVQRINEEYIKVTGCINTILGKCILSRYLATIRYDTHKHTHRLMEDIYELHDCQWLSFHDRKSHVVWIRHSKLDGAVRHIQLGDLISLFLFFKIRIVGWNKHINFFPLHLLTSLSLKSNVNSRENMLFVGITWLVARRDNDFVKLVVSPETNDDHRCKVSDILSHRCLLNLH
jgi:hypothetical protein